MKQVTRLTPVAPAGPAGRSRIADLRSVDLNLLVILDMLLTYRNVTRASEQLHLSQSATSNALTRMRRLFDDPLLVRAGRGLELTPLAESICEPVREALRSIERVLADRTGFDPATARRSFTLTASDYVASTVLGAVMRRLAVIAPHVHLNVRTLADDLDQQLGRGLVDLAIIPAHTTAMAGMADFPRSALWSDPFVVAVAADNSTVGEAITLKQFESLPYVSHSLPYVARPVIRDQHLSFVEDELRRRRVRVNHRCHFSVPYTSLPFLLAGAQAMAYLPRRLAEQAQAMGAIRVVGSPIDLPTLDESVYWNPARVDDPALDWLRSTILSVATATGA